jgi:WD40 repeat protein
MLPFKHGYIADIKVRRSRAETDLCQLRKSCKTIKIWDMVTGECLKTLQGHTNDVLSVTISPDNKTLASASNDQTVRLWNIETGECEKILQGHTNWVWSVAFSPDGRQIASGSYDCTIRLWDVESGKCLKIMDNKPYAGMNITNIKGLTSTEKDALKALGAVSETK